MPQGPPAGRCHILNLGPVLTPVEEEGGKEPEKKMEKGGGMMGRELKRERRGCLHPGQDHLDGACPPGG